MSYPSYVILVIDDDLVGPDSRRSRYEDVFGNSAMFTLKYVDKCEDLNSIKTEHADAYLIDIFLEKWGGLCASDVMQKYIAFAPRPAPVFLVSAKWGQRDVTEELKRVMEFGEISQHGSRVKHYFSWDEFSVDETNEISPQVAERTRRKLQMELDFWHGRSYAQLGDNDSVRILHISDTQYGDPAFSGDSRLDEETIGRYLLNHQLSPHLVAITGDISYSGCPAEFRKAQAGLERLVSSVFDCGLNIDSFRERIVLVPGNHDVNLRFSSNAYYSYTSFDGQSEKPTLSKIMLDPSNATTDYDEYSWKPFREFAFSFTRDRMWLDQANRSLCWLSNRFSHWGLQFIPLNTVGELNCRAPSAAGITEADLQPLNEEFRNEGVLFRVALAHHGREELGGYSENSPWQLLGAFLATNNIQLLLHGHRHEAKGDYVKDQCFGECTLNVSIAPSLTLNSRARRENSLRGFTVIDLKREHGTVVSGDIYPFEIRSTNIIPGPRTQLLLCSN